MSARHERPSPSTPCSFVPPVPSLRLPLSLPTLRSRLYSQVYTGASIWAAQRLVAGMSDIAINWSGGQTHARRDCASGFSYINDTVLATLYLLQGFQRVLFVNLDACHASGMEEAFYTTDRVLCVSLHRHGDGFFPGSGGARDSGQEAGQHHNINLPVREGLTDADLGMLFTPVIAAAAQRYQPQAVIICAGTGILSGDRLGCMNITLDGYLGALRSLLAMKRPTLLLGGSGYTQSTALRAWCAATALACGVELPDTIPDHEFFLYYSPKYRLRLDPSTLHNKNTIETLTATRDTALEIVRAIPTHEPRLLPPITVPSIEAHSSAGNFSLGGLGADEALAPSPNPDAERAPVGGMMRPGSVPHLSGVSGTRKGIGAAGATAGSVKEAVGTESSNSRAGVAAGNSLPAPQPMELDTEFNVERRPTLAPLPHSGLPLADPPPAPAAKGE